MRTANIVDKQISDSLVQLTLLQKKAVLGVIRAFAAEEDGFEKEMNRRFAELENGTVKGYSWEEVTDHARLAYKASKKKK